MCTNVAKVVQEQRELQRSGQGSRLTWVSSTATSLGSASVSWPPENRAVGTFMSWTRY